MRWSQHSYSPNGPKAKDNTSPIKLQIFVKLQKENNKIQTENWDKKGNYRGDGKPNNLWFARNQKVFSTNQEKKRGKGRRNRGYQQGDQSLRLSPNRYSKSRARGSSTHGFEQTDQAIDWGCKATDFSSKWMEEEQGKRRPPAEANRGRRVGGFADVGFSRCG